MQVFSLFPHNYLTNVTVKYLPEWFPGAGFKKKAKIWRKTVLNMPNAPFQFVKEQIVSVFPWFSDH
jgi:hypothetical protein